MTEVLSAGDSVSRRLDSLGGSDHTTLPATSLVDLLDRLIGAGVVVSGDVTISLAGIDLLTLRLRALISAVHEAQR